LIPPLLYRDLIDNAIVKGDTTRLNWLAVGMIGIPLLSAAIGFGQRYLSANIGEGLIADLRNALFNHMQQMGLRFFTHTKTGALMSRLNNDVVGAQRALTGTFINIVTNLDRDRHAGHHVLAGMASDPFEYRYRSHISGAHAKGWPQAA
jgi:ATP-binding cassette subfamily B protein